MIAPEACRMHSHGDHRGLNNRCEVFINRCGGELTGYRAVTNLQKLWHITSFGHISTGSFYLAHHITMGGMGAVPTDDFALRNIVAALRNWERDCWCKPGCNDISKRRFGCTWGSLPANSSIECRIIDSLEKTEMAMKDFICIGAYPGMSCKMIEYIHSAFYEFMKDKWLAMDHWMAKQIIHFIDFGNGGRG